MYNTTLFISLCTAQTLGKILHTIKKWQGNYSSQLAHFVGAPLGHIKTRKQVKIVPEQSLHTIKYWQGKYSSQLVYLVGAPLGHIAKKQITTDGSNVPDFHLSNNVMQQSLQKKVKKNRA